MPAPKRLVLFVEGEGDVKAVPVLVSHLLNELNAWDCLFLDPNPMRVRNAANLCGRNEGNWKRFLGVARKRRELGGVLVLLDGDRPLPGQKIFCPFDTGRDLAGRAQQEGAGSLFSLATVFAVQEYESWLIASAEALAGKLLSPDNRPGLPSGVLPPTGDLENILRDAKGWLNKQMNQGYKPTVDQGPLTSLMVKDLEPIRQRNLRAFRRLQSALEQLVNAIRTGKHLVTPSP